MHSAKRRTYLSAQIKHTSDIFYLVWKNNGRNQIDQSTEQNYREGKPAVNFIVAQIGEQ